MRFILKIKLPSWLVQPFISASLFFHRLRFGRSACFIYIARLRFAVIDHADYEKVKWFKWRLCRSGRIRYAFCTLSHGPLLPQKAIFMHHIVLPPPPGHCIDHKNHIGLDNRLQNLRIATPSENNHNARKTKSKTSSKYKGVDFVKPTKKWRARIAVNNKRLFLGSFADELDAAIAYDVAALMYFKEYACLNFPDQQSYRSVVPRVAFCAAEWSKTAGDEAAKKYFGQYACLNNVQPSAKHRRNVLQSGTCSATGQLPHLVWGVLSE